jgi:hypothetical protein
MPKGWEGRLAHPVAWVAIVMLVAFAAIGLHTAGTEIAWVEMAGAMAVTVTFAAWRIPWGRLPNWALLVLPIGSDLVIALLRQAQGGSTSGYSPLAILPARSGGPVHSCGHRRARAYGSATIGR